MIAYVGLYRVAHLQTQVSAAGRPLDTIRSCHIMPTHAHRTLRNTDHSVGLEEKPTEKCSVSASFYLDFIRPKPTDFLDKNRKTDRATFQFRFITLVAAVSLAWRYSGRLYFRVPVIITASITCDDQRVRGRHGSLTVSVLCERVDPRPTAR